MLVDLRGVEPLTSALRTQEASAESANSQRLTEPHTPGRTEGRTAERGIDEGSAKRVRTAELFQPSIRPRVGEFWKLTPEERARLAEELERSRRVIRANPT